MLLLFLSLRLFFLSLLPEDSGDRVFPVAPPFHPSFPHPHHSFFVLTSPPTPPTPLHATAACRLAPLDCCISRRGSCTRHHYRSGHASTLSLPLQGTAKRTPPIQLQDGQNSRLPSNPGRETSDSLASRIWRWSNPRLPPPLGGDQTHASSPGPTSC